MEDTLALQKLSHQVLQATVLKLVSLFDKPWK